MQDKINIENVVQEIMGLVSTYAQMHRASFMGSAKENSAYRSEADKTRNKIESKLRNLAENSFYVREPLRDEVIKMIDDSTHFHESTDWSIRFARAIERAHNITKDS